jgi:hypothetical protein
LGLEDCVATSNACDGDRTREMGETGEEMRERMGRAEGGDVGVFDTHR